ncbi:MAG TPA: hypothetical protein VE871_10125 [Longimicrobium sp.]|nr:hypothetical protein [Longimicrobium sp.]
MSYDLDLFRPPAHGDALAAARASYESEDYTPPAPDSGWRERMHAAAAAVTEADFSLEAEHAGEGPLEERIELNGPEEGTGLQILVFASAAYVHLPFWHDGQDAEDAWEQAWSLLRVLERETGWRTYDPQLDRVLDLDADRAEVLAEYARGVATARALSNAPIIANEQRPWWKLWG